MPPLSRRALLKLAGLGTAAGTAAFGAAGASGQSQPFGTMEHASHTSGPMGRVSTDGFDPSAFLRSFNFSHLPAEQRGRFYRETNRPDGSLLREYELVAVDREIEIAPGMFFPAWTFNGQVPGPTLRANEGERLRIHFANGSAYSHTMHIHVLHSAFQDGLTLGGR